MNILICVLFEPARERLRERQFHYRQTKRAPGRGRPWVVGWRLRSGRGLRLPAGAGKGEYPDNPIELVGLGDSADVRDPE